MEIYALTDLKHILQDHQDKGLSVVLTNGCFDILHVGHVRYLQAAKTQGDILVVGINSDRSVQALKGSNRPMNREADRAEVVAALACVDYVTIFNEDTADYLLKALTPDIYVKGGDYTLEKLPERKTVLETGIQTVFIPFAQGYNTTELLTRIQQSHA